MTESLMGAMRKAAAFGFDHAISIMRYEDGTPLEVIKVINPFRDADTDGSDS